MQGYRQSRQQLTCGTAGSSASESLTAAQDQYKILNLHLTFDYVRLSRPERTDEAADNGPLSVLASLRQTCRG